MKRDGKYSKNNIDIIDPLLKCTLIVCVMFLTLIFIDISIKTVESNHVNIENYSESVDYGILSQKQIEIFDKIICAVENKDKVVHCSLLSSVEKQEILTQLGLYYGDINKLGFFADVWNDNKIILNLELLQQLSENKAIIDARVDEAVSSLIEGSDKFKLWQISNYITARIEYTKNHRDTISALNGKGVCGAYAVLFYKMATRIGIETYICYGYVEDSYHAWNMVDLGGEYVYYDITWYDKTVHDVRYIYNKSTWGRSLKINNAW